MTSKKTIHVVRFVNTVNGPILGDLCHVSVCLSVGLVIDFLSLL